MGMNAAGALSTPGIMSLRETARLMASQPGTAAASSLKLTGQGEAPEEDSFSSDFDCDNVKIAAGIGAGVGAVAGGILMYQGARRQIEALPVNTVSLDWDEPVMKQKVLGKVPDDYYEHNFIFDWPSSPDPRSWSDVVRPAPVLDATGKPYTQHMQRTWSDHGDPRVTWNRNISIKDPVLTGYSHYTSEDSHYDSVPVGTDDEGKTIYEEVEEIDGWWHRFSPDIKGNPTGYTYDKPDVSFYTGVNVFGRTMLGVIGGAMLGAVSSGLAAAAYNRAMR